MIRRISDWLRDKLTPRYENEVPVRTFRIPTAVIEHTGRILFFRDMIIMHVRCEYYGCPPDPRYHWECCSIECDIVGYGESYIEAYEQFVFAWIDLWQHIAAADDETLTEQGRNVKQDLLRVVDKMEVVLPPMHNSQSVNVGPIIRRRISLTTGGTI